MEQLSLIAGFTLLVVGAAITLYNVVLFALMMLRRRELDWDPIAFWGLGFLIVSAACFDVGGQEELSRAALVLIILEPFVWQCIAMPLYISFLAAKVLFAFPIVCYEMLTDLWTYCRSRGGRVTAPQPAQSDESAVLTPVDHLVGCLLGTAVGDAIGLPYEGLSRTRAARLLGPPERHRLLFGLGMVSDDTEHACMVAQALIESCGDVTSFQRQLAWRLRRWLLGMPAGVGLATLRTILRLWIGINPERSGVFSAGNGPAMRAAILGAALDDPTALARHVRVSTRLTHTDPKAEHAAFAVAWAARMARSTPDTSPQRYVEELRDALGSSGEELIPCSTTQPPRPGVERRRWNMPHRSAFPEVSAATPTTGCPWRSTHGFHIRVMSAPR